MDGIVQLPGQAPDDGAEGLQMRMSIDAAYSKLREHADAIVGLVASIRALETWQREATERIGALEISQRSSESAQARLSGAMEGIVAAQQALRLAIEDISATTHSTNDKLSRLLDSWTSHVLDESESTAKRVTNDADEHAKRMKMIVRIFMPLGAIAAAIVGAMSVWHFGSPA